VQMKTIGTTAAVIALLGASWGQTQRPDVNVPKPLNGEVRPFSKCRASTTHLSEVGKSEKPSK
jgi:hypothetical protein